MNPLQSLLLGSVALLVAGVGLLDLAWELRRRNPETEVGV